MVYMRFNSNEIDKVECTCALWNVNELNEP